MTRIYMKHVRKAVLCSRGARGFFELHKLDWNDFLQNGIEAEKLLETGDAQAALVVETARGEE